MAVHITKKGKGSGFETRINGRTYEVNPTLHGKTPIGEEYQVDIVSGSWEEMCDIISATAQELKAQGPPASAPKQPKP